MQIGINDVLKVTNIYLLNKYVIKLFIKEVLIVLTILQMFNQL